MKKYLFLAFVLALIVCSCTKESDTDTIAKSSINPKLLIGRWSLVKEDGKFNPGAFLEGGLKFENDNSFEYGLGDTNDVDQFNGNYVIFYDVKGKYSIEGDEIIYHLNRKSVHIDCDENKYYEDLRYSLSRDLLIRKFSKAKIISLTKSQLVLCDNGVDTLIYKRITPAQEN